MVDTSTEIWFLKYLICAPFCNTVRSDKSKNSENPSS